jgi:hypothetical protein
MNCLHEFLNELLEPTVIFVEGGVELLSELNHFICISCGDLGIFHVSFLYFLKHGGGFDLLTEYRKLGTYGSRRWNT